MGCPVCETFQSVVKTCHSLLLKRLLLLCHVRKAIKPTVVVRELSFIPTLVIILCYLLGLRLDPWPQIVNKLYVYLEAGQALSLINDTEWTQSELIDGVQIGLVTYNILSQIEVGTELHNILLHNTSNYPDDCQLSLHSQLCDGCRRHFKGQILLPCIFSK